jgi:hypothetical protein
MDPQSAMPRSAKDLVNGYDPRQSVLDVHCRTHDIDNLYVVDGSFFASSGAVNPSLTIMANALRVGDHLLERLRGRRRTPTSRRPSASRKRSASDGALVHSRLPRLRLLRL